MKLAKVLLVSSLSLAALAPAASAADVTYSSPSQTIQSQVNVDEASLNPDFVLSKLTEEQITRYQNLTPVTPTYNAPTDGFKIMAAAMSYTIESLSGGNSLTSNSSFTTKSKGPVYLTLVQWNKGILSGKPNVVYTLINSNGDEVVSRRVTEEYTHTNTTVRFDNVPAGRYNLLISNMADGTVMAGNGYIEF